MTNDRLDNNRHIKARTGFTIVAKPWTTEEAVAGMTINAARALGLAHDIGSIEPGKAADLCAWRVDDLSELAYWIGMPGPERRIFGGLDGEGG